MKLITLLGLIAGFCTTVAIIPQVLKTVKTRNTRDLSLGMYVILASGVFLWSLYGAIIGDLPVFIANSVTLIFIIVVLVYKIKYK
ncbi:SemiSWEET transporter [Fibrobacterota bacterium]